VIYTTLELNVVSRIIGWDTLGPFGQLIQAMTAIMGDFESFEFSHEGHRSNVDAHNLAIGSFFPKSRATCLVFKSTRWCLYKHYDLMNKGWFSKKSYVKT
jgi:hypothetical protein